MPPSDSPNWKIYRGDGQPRGGIELPNAPSWRTFRDDAKGL
jgi:hypothetical protein